MKLNSHVTTSVLYSILFTICPSRISVPVALWLLLLSVISSLSLFFHIISVSLPVYHNATYIRALKMCSDCFVDVLVISTTILASGSASLPIISGE